MTEVSPSTHGPRVTQPGGQAVRPFDALSKGDVEVAGARAPTSGS